MRQKPFDKKALNRMVGFLERVQYLSDVIHNLTLGTIATEEGVTRSAPKILTDLKVIEKHSTTSWTWNKDSEPSEKLAMIIYNALLERNPKSLKADAIPEFATLTGQLTTIIDKLDTYINQSQNSFKRAVNAPKELPLVQGDNLFSESDQYHKDFVYLAGHVLHGLISSGSTDATSFSSYTIEITTDLLNKINSIKSN